MWKFSILKLKVKKKINLGSAFCQNYTWGENEKEIPKYILVQFYQQITNISFCHQSLSFSVILMSLSKGYPVQLFMWLKIMWMEKFYFFSLSETINKASGSFKLAQMSKNDYYIHGRCPSSWNFYWNSKNKCYLLSNINFQFGLSSYRKTSVLRSKHLIVYLILWRSSGLAQF